MAVHLCGATGAVERLSVDVLPFVVRSSLSPPPSSRFPASSASHRWRLSSAEPERSRRDHRYLAELPVLPPPPVVFPLRVSDVGSADSLTVPHRSRRLPHLRVDPPLPIGHVLARVRGRVTGAHSSPLLLRLRLPSLVLLFLSVFRVVFSAQQPRSRVWQSGPPLRSLRLRGLH